MKHVGEVEVDACHLLVGCPGSCSERGSHVSVSYIRVHFKRSVVSAFVSSN